MLIFISYSSRDREAAEALAGVLGELGHDVQFEHKLAGGQVGWYQVFDSIKDADLFIFALTPQSLRSYSCKTERDYALALNKRVLTVLLKPSDLHTLLPELLRIPPVDYCDPNEQTVQGLSEALEQLPPPDLLPDPLPLRSNLIAPLTRLREQIYELPTDFNAQTAILFNLQEFLERRETFEDAKALLNALYTHKDVSPRIAGEIKKTFAEISRTRSLMQTTTRRMRLGRDIGLFVSGIILILVLIRGVQFIQATSQESTPTSFPNLVGSRTAVALANVLSRTPTPQPTLRRTATSTPTSSVTSSRTSTYTATSKSTLSPTATLNIQQTADFLSGQAAAVQKTQTALALPTNTPLPTFTFTPSSTATFTPTFTATNLPTKTFTLTPTPTYTYTPLPSATFTPTRTPSPTATFSPVPPTFTFTPLPSATFTPTWTRTPSPTATFSPVPPTLTSTPSSTATFTSTNTPTLTDQPITPMVFPIQVYVGITVEDTDQGLRVSKVGETASAAEIRVGDYLIDVDLQPVANRADFMQRMSSYHPLSQVAMRFRRNSQFILTRLTLGIRDFAAPTATPTS